MAISTCPKCNGIYFEVETKEPLKSNYKLAFVQCIKCGCVVGTMEYYNIGSKIEELEKKVDMVSSNYSNIISNLDIVNRNVAGLYDLIKRLKIKD